MADLFKNKQGGEPIEANLLTKDNVKAVTLWCNGVEVVEIDPFDSTITFAAINVPTVNGMKRAQEGMWIIRRPGGDFYPVLPDRFQELFDPVV